MENSHSIFGKIYNNNGWGDPESRSGSGSNLVQTGMIRREIPLLLKEYGIQTMLDIPCGDFYWMKEIKGDLELLLVSYTGGDLVPELIQQNQKAYSDEKINFCLLDITGSQLPKTDLIFVRDCLVHLSYRDIVQALKNIKRSGSTYLLTTHFTGNRLNKDIRTGDWRPLNLLDKPFFFPKPLVIINENCTEDNNTYTDKSLGLWRITELSILKMSAYLWLKRWYAHMVVGR